jgi:hypothetical protein
VSENFFLIELNDCLPEVKKLNKKKEKKTDHGIFIFFKVYAHMWVRRRRSS